MRAVPKELLIFYIFIFEIVIRMCFIKMHQGIPLRHMFSAQCNIFIKMFKYKYAWILTVKTFYHPIFHDFQKTCLMTLTYCYKFSLVFIFQIMEGLC